MILHKMSQAFDALLLREKHDQFVSASELSACKNECLPTSVLAMCP